MAAKKILFVTSECSPFAKVGGLADVAAALPRALNKEGLDVRLIMPLYKKIKNEYFSKLNFIRWSMVKMGWRTVYSGIFSMEYEGVKYYFVDNEYYFGHRSIYINYDFDIERYVFFQRAVLEAMGEAIDFCPDIIHCNDWQAGLIPVLLKAHYQNFSSWTNVKTIFTIHNLKYQGLYSFEKISDYCDLSPQYMNDYGVTVNGVPNFLKAALVYSDYITTVSETYASEILDPYYAEGLEHVLQNYRYKLKGIVNGIDDLEYNPRNDKNIYENYDVRNYKEKKALNKSLLQKELSLEQNSELPLVSMVSRLVDQKGLDLILHVADEILNIPCQLLILGTGDKIYEDKLRELEYRYKGKMVAFIAYDNVIAHRIYAGSDIFLMPSIFEPCGLSQLISLSYGTLPLVRETGGLKDTVEAYNEHTDTGNGFSFTNINAHDMLHTLEYACHIFKTDKQAWNRLIIRAMSKDYSWKKSALRYIELYDKIAQND